MLRPLRVSLFPQVFRNVSKSSFHKASFFGFRKAYFSTLESNMNSAVHDAEFLENPKTSENKSAPINEVLVGEPSKHAFKAETKRLLEIVANSLYSEKEVFVRELVSNASDACEKLRYFQLTHSDALAAPDHFKPLGIHISLDEDKKLFILQDYGIGMDKKELEENLGTIALSGASKFLKQISQDKGDTKASKDNNIIGQFGVGFYSAFTVGTQIDVYSRSALKGSLGYSWSSDGLGEFSLCEASNVDIGTKIVVHLKPSEAQYSQKALIETIIKKYSNFVGFPVFLNGQQINTIQPLWLMDKSTITEQQYEEFYKYLADAYDGPQYHLHYSTDAPVQIRSLLFVPKTFPMLGFQNENSNEGKISLFCKKVLIKGKTSDLLPPWLSFVQGVVDSEDIPLNLSRELLQNNLLIQKIKRVLTGRIIKWFLEEHRRDPAAFSLLYRKIAPYIKGGVMSDQTHRSEIMNLLLFESNFSDAGSLITLNEYLEKMSSGQTDIYVCLGKSREAALQSPYLEPFQKKNLPVLFSYDAMDEFLVGSLDTYQGKKFVRIEDAKLDSETDAESLQTDGSSEHNTKLATDEAEALSSWILSLFGTRVKSVKAATRSISLTQPALIVDHAMHAMTMRYMRQMMAAQGASNDVSSMSSFQPPVDLEINPRHPIIVGLNRLKTSQPDLAGDIAAQILDNALLQAGLLEEPQPMVQRVNSLLSKLVDKS